MRDPSRLKIILSLIVALLLAPSVVLHAADLSGNQPTILRAVDPVRPGETVLLVGDWPITASVEVAQLEDHADRTALSWHPLESLEVSSQSMKFTIPATWAMGAYACRVVGDGASALNTSATVMLNVPDPWWLQGDGGATAASPGG